MLLSLYKRLIINFNVIVIILYLIIVHSVVDMSSLVVFSVCVCVCVCVCVFATKVAMNIGLTFGVVIVDWSVIDC